MKKTRWIGFLFITIAVLTGCGAGIVYQTSQKDIQATSYTDTKNKVKSLFYEGQPSIGVYYMNAAINIDDDGFQIISKDENKQTSCEWAVGDPLVLDNGPLANVRYEVSLKGCNAAVSFDEQEKAVQFAKLLYTLKQQAVENNIAANIPPSKPVAEKKVNLIQSDIDIPPTLHSRVQTNAYAIVIGIENYRQKLPKADFAVSDANLICEYLIRVLGYPEENVITLLNDRASYVDLAKYFEKWLGNNVEKDSTVFIYYSGHGSPNPKTGDAYLVPYDGDPSFIDQTGYSLKRMYEALGKLPAKEIIVVLDSCFSGAGGRSVLAKGAKPLVMTLNTPNIQKNITVMTASSGDQISSAYDEKGHGLFTYFLLKGIKNEDVVKPNGSIEISDLYSYIKPQVERIARKQFNNEQTPQLIMPDKN